MSIDLVEWINTKELGTLYTEKILVDYGCPVLFIVINKETQQRYIVLCIEDDYKYLIGSISNEELLEFLNGNRFIGIVFEEAKVLGLVTWKGGVEYEEITYRELLCDYDISLPVSKLDVNHSNETYRKEIEELVKGV